MRILFDHGTPSPLRQVLGGHEVTLAYALGWQTLRNGDLLANAEAGGFEALVTTDQNIRYQQNLVGRRLAILVLMTTDRRSIRRHVSLVAEAVDGLTPGAYVEVSIPSP